MAKAKAELADLQAETAAFRGAQSSLALKMSYSFIDKLKAEKQELREQLNEAEALNQRLRATNEQQVVTLQQSKLRQETELKETRSQLNGTKHCSSPRVRRLPHLTVCGLPLQPCGCLT